MRRHSSVTRILSVGLMSIVLMLGITTVFLTQQGCKTSAVATTPGKPRDEKLITLALGCKNVTAGVTMGISVKRALLADGKITPDTSSQLTTYLTKVQNVTNELNELGGTFDTFTVGKADLFKVFQSLVQARKDLEANGTIPGFMGLSGEIFKAIDAGVDILKPLFQ